MTAQQAHSHDLNLADYGVAVRVMRPADISAVATLLSEAFYATDAWWGWVTPLMYLGMYQDLKLRCMSPKSAYTCLVCVRAGPQGVKATAQIVGTVEITTKPLSAWAFNNPAVPYISNLAVVPEWRRRGVGQKLLRSCEQVARGWGFHELYLHVKRNNRAARGLYERVGYFQDHSDLQSWSFVLGQAQQILLKKSLSPLP